MRGLPSHFATKQDILNCLAMDPHGTKTMLNNLLDGRMGWFPVADLAEGDPGLEDELHTVRIEPAEGEADLMGNPDAPMKRVQYEKQDDLLSQLYRLGLTVADVNGFIRECDARG